MSYESVDPFTGEVSEYLNRAHAVWCAQKKSPSVEDLFDGRTPAGGWRLSDGWKKKHWALVARNFARLDPVRDYRPDRFHAVMDVAKHCTCPCEMNMQGIPPAGPARFKPTSSFGSSRHMAIAVEKELRRSGMPPDEDALFDVRVEHMVDSLSGGSRDRFVDPKLTRVPLYLTLLVPCGKCLGCKRFRAQQWYNRTMREWLYMLSKHSVPISHRDGQSCGVWIFTGTCTPAQHEMSRNVARAVYAARGVDFDQCTIAEQFRARLKYFYNPRVTRFLERVKYDGDFRYLLVWELHGGGGQNDGEPHVHALLFETNHARPLRYQCIMDAWAYDKSLGTITEAALCKPRDPSQIHGDWIGRVVHYVTKYIVKSPVTRIRCSNAFGSPERWDPEYPKLAVPLPEASGEEDAVAVAPGGAVSKMSAVDLRSEQEPRECPSDAPVLGADALQSSTESAGLQEAVDNVYQDSS